MSSFEKRTTEFEYIGIDGGTLITYVDSDRLAEERADNVAFYGLWEKHAHSGFEDTVGQIAEIVKRDIEHEYALELDAKRDYELQEEKDRIESEEREHIAFHITVPTAISEGFMHSPIHLNKHYLDNPMRQAVEEIKDSIHEAYKYGDIGEAHRDQLLSNLKPWQHEALCREFELEEKAERNWHDESDPTNGNECDWDLDGSEYRWAQEIRMKEQNPDLNHGLVDLRTIEVNDGPNGEAVDGYGNLLD